MMLLLNENYFSRGEPKAVPQIIEVA